MSASSRLLYILPDVAYVAELLPAKQPHSFVVHSFRQINGNFITEEQLLEENLNKLLDKLEPGEYQVILPDFLFTNTIINVKATGEAQVKEYIKSKLLPSLGIDKTTHQVETFVLTELKGVFKVQLSALEKSLIESLAQGMADRALLVSSVVSVSWALKSIISLEPSLSVVQLGEQLYLAQHYIGVDQAISAPVAEAENLVDTVKTLKGAEPSIQTIYLLASDLVAERLRQGLHDTVPLQQLAVFDEAEGKLPSYLKQTIEAMMRTLSTPEYEIPRFVLEAKKGPVKVTMPVTVADEPGENIAESNNLPTPTGLKAAHAGETASTTKVIDLTQPVETKSVTQPEKIIDLTANEVDPMVTFVSREDRQTVAVATTTGPTVQPMKTHSPSAEMKVEELTTVASTSATTLSATKPSAKPSVIKNKTDVNELMKLIGIGVISFIVTVGIGIGLGLVLVVFTNRQLKPNALMSALSGPTPVPSMTSAPSPTPTASPSSQVDPAKVKLLIVNATTIPGHAGKVAQTLKAAGFTSIQTGNAKGQYQKGNYLLMKTADASLLDALKTKTGLENLTTQTGVSTEDADGKYTAVLVLAE